MTTQQIKREIEALEQRDTLESGDEARLAMLRKALEGRSDA